MKSMTNKNNKNIIIGVSASIAIYKTPVLIRRLQELGHNCRVVMSQNAEKLIAAQVFEAISNYHVYTNEFGDKRESSMDHITLKNWGEIMIYYPATANLIGQLSAGIAASLLTTIFLAFNGPVVVAPAMNPDMYSHPLVINNVSNLKKIGVTILDPEGGILACGEEGRGKLIEADSVITLLKQKNII